MWTKVSIHSVLYSPYLPYIFVCNECDFETTAPAVAREEEEEEDEENVFLRSKVTPRRTIEFKAASTSAEKGRLTCAEYCINPLHHFV